MTVASLFCFWILIGGVCAAGCAVARFVGRRVDDAEQQQSRRQWQTMCQALGAEGLGPSHPNDRVTSSPVSPRHASPDREAIPTEAVR
jgi:hypothetical protein